jgi:murein DD-endopeptidase MepM/ murein hydrolase activator NlpD
LTNAGLGRFFAAFILASFAAVSAWAQSPAQTSTKDQPTEKQSSEKRDTQKPEQKESKLITEEIVVTPPAPTIVKKNTTTIAIPAEGVGNESKYLEQQAAASSVNLGSGFGYRRDPFTRRAKFHSGVDIKARWGDAVGASLAGIVTFAGWYHGYGNMIIISHGGGVTTHYAHLSSFDVEVGTRVDRGTIIGRAGSTGRATSPHLHYELRIDGNPLHPFQPLALDPSSGYFKDSRPTVDAGREDAAPTSGAQKEK